MTKWIRKLFCKHEWGEFTKDTEFLNISGETRYIICKKCGKEKGSYFAKYEGMGFR